METYSNNSGNSGVQAYEIGLDNISVKFSGNSRIYSYSYTRAGRDNVEEMKSLARNGTGLNGYINRCVRDLYDR